MASAKNWGVRLIAPAKISEHEGASHQPAFMSNHQTLSHTFYSAVYPVDEGNRDVGLV